MLQLKNQRCESKIMGGFSIFFNLEKIYEVLKSKNPWLLLNKNINFNKNKTELKVENPIHVFRGTNLILQFIYTNHESKVTLWWVGFRETKKSAFYVALVLSKGHLVSIYVLSQCRLYRLTFQNIYSFTYQKTLLPTLFCLLLKSSETFNVSLKRN